MATKRKAAPRGQARTEKLGGEEGGLRAEISLLRELVHQVGALAEADGPLNEQVRLLDAVGRACGHLARLMRAQGALGEEDAAAEEIGRILDEMRHELETRGRG